MEPFANDLEMGLDAVRFAQHPGFVPDPLRRPCCSHVHLATAVGPACWEEPGGPAG